MSNISGHSSRGDTTRQKTASFLALFTSTGTLLCCALPSAIAALAGGAAVVSFVSTFPWLIELSRYKDWLFLVAGVMIVFSWTLVYRPKGKVACRITGGEGCEIASRFTKVILWTSAGIFVVGAFFAYALVPILRIIDA